MNVEPFRQLNLVNIIMKQCHSPTLVKLFAAPIYNSLTPKIDKLKQDYSFCYKLNRHLQNYEKPDNLVSKQSYLASTYRK